MCMMRPGPPATGPRRFHLVRTNFVRSPPLGCDWGTSSFADIEPPDANDADKLIYEASANDNEALKPVGLWWRVISVLRERASLLAAAVRGRAALPPPC
jgi:hypothetical protein